MIIKREGSIWMMKKKSQGTYHIVRSLGLNLFLIMTIGSNENEKKKTSVGF